MLDYKNKTIDSREHIKVEILKNFPFKSFEEFREAWLRKKIKVIIDKSISFRWIERGLYRSEKWWKMVILIMWLPYLAILGFIISSIILRRYHLIAFVPIHFLAIILLHPTGRKLFKIFNILGIGIIFLFIWSLTTKNINLLLITIILVIILICEEIAWNIPHRLLMRAIYLHEDLLCYLWNDNLVAIKLKEGPIYLNDEIIGGKEN